ncbi:hypothetical protein HD806DRAFT_466922 [Xylariaceae sp. AK1471]|nr:hypothetical protein HD806DRAFT_466922 [Xylariaceae sp. AK1471]
MPKGSIGVLIRIICPGLVLRSARGRPPPSTIADYIKIRRWTSHPVLEAGDNMHSLTFTYAEIRGIRSRHWDQRNIIPVLTLFDLHLRTQRKCSGVPYSNQIESSTNEQRNFYRGLMKTTHQQQLRLTSLLP